MFLLVTKDTKLDFINGPKAPLLKGVVLQTAADCPEDEFVVRTVDAVDGEPPSFKMADGFDYAFPRRVYANILEYTTWDALRAVARTCQPQSEERRRSQRYARVIQASQPGVTLVRLVNISTTGVGFQSGEKFEVGSELTVKALSHELRASVVHATEQPNGTWIVGAMLVEPLNEDELQELLSAGASE